MLYTCLIDTLILLLWRTVESRYRSGRLNDWLLLFLPTAALSRVYTYIYH